MASAFSSAKVLTLPRVNWLLRFGCLLAPRLAVQIGALAAVLALALWLRLFDLNNPTDNFDEGAYLSGLFLMRHGYQPFVDINTGEGPLNLHLAYISYAAGGFTLMAARVGTALISTLGVAGAAWAGWALAGPVVGLMAAFALAISPTFLRTSRWVGPEAMAVAIALIAIGAAAQALRTDRDRYRLLSGALVAVANLIQASVPMAALAVGILAYKRSSPRASLLAPLMALAAVIAVVLAVGPVTFFERVVGWRVGGGQLLPSAEIIGHNAELLIDKMFRQEQPALYALAAVGGVGALRSAPRIGLALVGWLLAQLALLLTYSELSGHLGVTLLAPLVLLAGFGLATAGQALRWATRNPSLRSLAALLPVAVVLWYAASVPAILERDRRTIEDELSTDRSIGRVERNVVKTIKQLAGPDEFVLTDQPYLAFLADRKVPPELVDPSSSRINSGRLTGEQVVAELHRRDIKVVALWTGKLGRLPALTDTLATEYELVAQYGDNGNGIPRAIYRKR